MPILGISYCDDADREWKIIRSAPDYEVSNDGIVRRAIAGRSNSAPKGRVIRQYVGRTSYRMVQLWIDGHPKTRHVHRLVLEAFVGDPQDGEQVCHRDGDRMNNRSPNLYWGTAKDNAADRDKHRRTVRGSQVRHAKITERQAAEIFMRYKAGGVIIAELAREFGLSFTTTQKITAGRAWKHALQAQLAASKTAAAS